MHTNELDKHRTVCSEGPELLTGEGGEDLLESRDREGGSLIRVHSGFLVKYRHGTCVCYSVAEFGVPVHGVQGCHKGIRWHARSEMLPVSPSDSQELQKEAIKRVHHRCALDICVAGEVCLSSSSLVDHC